MNFSVPIELELAIHLTKAVSIPNLDIIAPTDKNKNPIEKIPCVFGPNLFATNQKKTNPQRYPITLITKTREAF